MSSEQPEAPLVIKLESWYLNSAPSGPKDKRQCCLLTTWSRLLVSVIICPCCLHSLKRKKSLGNLIKFSFLILHNLSGEVHPMIVKKLMTSRWIGVLLLSITLDYSTSWGSFPCSCLIDPVGTKRDLKLFLLRLSSLRTP